MPGQITDEMLDTFAVVGTYDQIVSKLKESARRLRYVHRVRHSDRDARRGGCAGLDGAGATELIRLGGLNL